MLFCKSSITFLSKLGILLCFVLISPTLQSCSGPNATASSAIAIFGGGEVLEDTLNQLETSALSVVESGEIAADRQIQHSAYELLGIISETRIAFSEELDTSLNRLDQNILRTTDTLVNIAEGLKAGEYELISAIDGASLDIERIVGNTVFAKYPFIFKRVIGLNKLYRENGDYTFELRGSGFGSSQIKVVKFSVDNTDITSDVKFSGISQNNLKVIIPPTSLNQFFDSDVELKNRNIRILPIDLELNRITISRKFIWFGSEVEKTESLTHRFFTYFIPNYAGEIEISSLGEEYQWQDVEPLTFYHNSANNHCNSDCDDQTSYNHGVFRQQSNQQECVTQLVQTPPREGDERLSAASFSPRSTFNHWGMAASINANETCVNFTVYSGTVSKQFQITASRQRYNKQPGIITLLNTKLPVEFGKLYTIRVPKIALVNNYKIDVVGATLLEEGELKGGKSTMVLEVVSENLAANEKVYQVKIKYPSGIR